MDEKGVTHPRTRKRATIRQISVKYGYDTRLH